MLLLVLTACRKVSVKEIEVQVEKKASWSEIKRFSGNYRIFQSSGGNASHLYFQQPYFFTSLSGADAYNGITVYGAALPTDLQVRIPIGPFFHAYPFPYDPSVPVVKQNDNPITSSSGVYLPLKRLDSSLVKIQTDSLDLFKCMAINRNGVVLLSYGNNRQDLPNSFFLAGIKVLHDLPYVDTLFTRKVIIPHGQGVAYVRHLSAINDCFLVNLDDGICKIKSDGSYSKVYGYAVADAFYGWQGRVYAHLEWDNLLVSDDDANSFPRYSGLPAFAATSNYYTIKDSLVGPVRTTCLSCHGPVRITVCGP